MNRQPLAVRCCPLAMFIVAAAAICAAQQPTVTLFGEGTISRPDTHESFGSLSRDGKEFFYTIHQANFGRHKIVVSRNVKGTWSAPEVVSFSGSFNDREPKLSPDGQRLYFSSNRPLVPGQPQGKLDLYMAERDGKGGWGPAQRRLCGSGLGHAPLLSYS